MTDNDFVDVVIGQTGFAPRKPGFVPRDSLGLGGNAVNPRCADIQQNVFARIQSARPELVILTADWTSSDVLKIGSSVSALRDAGMKNLLIIGPVPIWRDALPKVYWLYWRKYHQVLPTRTKFDLTPSGSIALMHTIGSSLVGSLLTRHTSQD